jgi:hypothetical protein
MPIFVRKNKYPGEGIKKAFMFNASGKDNNDAV